MPTVPAEAFQFNGPSYPAESTRYDVQRSINLYPEHGLPNSKSTAMLVGTPGRALFLTLPTAPVQALWAGSLDAVDGRLFAATASFVYELDPTGTVAQTWGPMSSGGPSYCVFKENGIQLLIANPNGAVYNVNTATGALDNVFSGTDLEYLDGFFISIGNFDYPASYNRIYVSAPLDGTTWPPLAFAQRTGSADQITRIAVINSQLWIFGLKKIEVWYNVGGAPFPFARIPGGTIDQGLLAAGSIAKLDNSIFWLGADDRGFAVVYRSNGLAAVRVSTYAIEQLIRNKYGNGMVFATAFPYQEAGHSFYVLNFNPATGTVSGTVVYDATTGEWHERASGSVTLTRDHPQCAASLGRFVGFSNQTPLNFVGDYANGNVYIQDLQFPADNGAAIQRTRIAPYVSNQNRWTKHTSLEIYGDVGGQIALSWSDDGGRTFPYSRAPISASTENPRSGYQRFKWWQLGRSRVRAYQAVINGSSTPVNLVEAFLAVNPGTEP